MVRLNTIGPLTIEVGESRLTSGSHQAFAALVYFTIERGKDIPRKSLVELFFPDSTDGAGAHALRQLVYRLRKMGVHIESDSGTVVFPRNEGTWDVEAVETRGHLTDAELESLSRGYLAHYVPDVSDAYDAWLEQHRSTVSTTLRRLLIAQLREEKAKHRFAEVDKVARACLALDPLNEEATLATAEALVMHGSKVEALAVLDRYIEEVGGRSRDLRLAPKLLRERISEYVVDQGFHPEPPLVGRDEEIATLRSLLARANSGSAEACVVWGPSGIGKSRLLNEACVMAALGGLAVIRCRLQPHDQRRPLAVLRDIAPRLLDLPGALGSSPESLMLMRGLCGRGEMPQRPIPKTTHESETALAEMLAAASDLLDSVCCEQPVLICVEDGHWVDAASLEFLVGVVVGQRSLCILTASQRALELPANLAAAASLHSLEVRRVSVPAAHTIIRQLAEQSGLDYYHPFADWAIGVADGVPFYLEALFAEYAATGDLGRVPPTLISSLASRLDRLVEPTRSLFDAIVIMGNRSTLARLEAIVQLPRYALVVSLRDLEERGLIRSTPSMVTYAHELYAATARRSMPSSVAKVLHRAIAESLEGDLAGALTVEPWEIAAHWQASGEPAKGLRVMRACAADALRIGRPQDAVAILRKAKSFGLAAEESWDVLFELIAACDAAGEWKIASEALEELLTSSQRRGHDVIPSDISISRAEYAYFSGRDASNSSQGVMETAASKAESTELRLRAAKLLMCFAEDTANTDLAVDALAAIADLEDGPASERFPQMIFHTVFGDLNTAEMLAEQLVREAELFSSPIRKQRALHSAGIVYFRCGKLDVAEKLYRSAFESALKSGSRSGQVVTGAALTFALWCAGRADEYRAWHGRVSLELARTAFPNLATEYYSNEILISLDAGRIEDAAAAVCQVEALYPTIKDGRWRAVRMSFSERVKLSKGLGASAESLEELASFLRKARSNGLQDTVADTLVWGLSEADRHQEASEIRREYLACRRERYPIPAPYKHLVGFSGFSP